MKTNTHNNTKSFVFTLTVCAFVNERFASVA